MTPQLVMAAVLVFGGGLAAAVSGLAWDLRMQRRDRRPDVGLSILRSDADDATPAEVLGLVDALRETAAADVVLSAAADAGHQGASRGARPAGSLPSRHMAGGPGGNPVRIRRSPLLDQVRPAWDAPTSQLPVVGAPAGAVARGAPGVAAAAGRVDAHAGPVDALAAAVGPAGARAGGGVMLALVPVSFADACGFIRLWHRHHSPPVGHRFSIGCADEAGILRGVVIVGRPVARHFDNGTTLEVTRCATDGTPNTASMLYGAAWRATSALGYRRLVTYTQVGESGASLRAAGYRVLAQRPARTGWTAPSRPREDRGVDGIPRTLWEVLA